jgi:hypothetical protein
MVSEACLTRAVSIHNIDFVIAVPPRNKDNFTVCFYPTTHKSDNRIKTIPIIIILLFIGFLLTYTSSCLVNLEPLLIASGPGGCHLEPLCSIADYSPYSSVLSKPSKKKSLAIFHEGE